MQPREMVLPLARDRYQRGDINTVVRRAGQNPCRDISDRALAS
jgi:hypothetical protein